MSSIHTALTLLSLGAAGVAISTGSSTSLVTLAGCTVLTAALTTAAHTAQRPQAVPVRVEDR